MSSSKDNLPNRAWILRSVPHAGPRVWGLTSAERTGRALRAAGVMRITEVSDEIDTAIDGSQLLFRDDIVANEHLVAALAHSPDTILMDPDRGVPVAAHVPAARASEAARWLRAAAALPRAELAGLRAVEPSRFGETWLPNLRRSATPRLHSLAGADAARIASIERDLFGASYKVVTDLVTKWVWPLPARVVVRWLANARVHPNQVTLASWVLAVLAALLFASGHFASGLLLAWLMTFLDTVDGKLARVTLQSSNFGHIFDHALDLLHPPFWYAAWAVGLTANGYPAGVLVTGSMWIVIAGYVAGRLLEGLFLLAFKIEIHSWTPLDSAFRTITARRNPNLILLTGGLLAGRADLALAAVAAWTLVSIAFHVARLVRAFGEQRQGREIAAWNAVSSATVVALIVAAWISAVPVAQAQDETTLSKPGPSDVSLAPTHGLRRGDPASRLSRGELAIETWDFTARFDSGHVLVLQFLHTNIGLGDGNVAMTGQLVMPEGRTVAFDTGDRAGDWKLSPDGMRLELKHGLLDHSARDVVLRFAKKDVAIDLRLTNTGPAGWPTTLSRLGYAVDLLESAAPIAGTIRVDGMTAPLAVSGRASSTHRWFDDLEARLVQRRIEFASASGDTSVWLIDALTPDGRNVGWLRIARGGGVLREVEVRTTTLGTATGVDGAAAHPGYDVPARVRVEGDGVSGILTFDHELVRYDPLIDLPLPIRAVVSVATRPQRIWSQSTFDLELTDPARSEPEHVRGSGIGEVTYLNPMAARSVHVDVPRASACKEDGCASAF